MSLRILPGGAIAALAGATMLALSSAPSPAFTLSSPSLERPVAAADIEPVWWHGGWHHGWHGGWHRNWHRGWGWHGGWHRWVRAGARDMALDRAGIAGGPRGACAAAAGSEGPRESGLLLGRTEAGRRLGSFGSGAAGRGEASAVRNALKTDPGARRQAPVGK